MFERKPHRSKVTSTEALVTGAERYAAFRQHIPLTGVLTASMVATVATTTGLSARQVRRLALRFRENPVAASLAPTPRGPKIGSHRISPEIEQALEGLIGNSASRCVLRADGSGGTCHAAEQALAGQPARPIEAYGLVKRRAMTARSSASQDQNGDVAEIRPQNPGERIRGLCAPSPI